MATPAPLAADRWVGVGRSDDPDPVKAGRQATRGAILGPEPRLLVVFASEALDPDALLAAIQAEAGNVPLIGCSTAGEIATHGPGDAGVVVLALGGDGFSVSTAAAADAPTRLRDAGAEAAACLADVAEREHVILLVLTDGLAGDQQEIVRGAYSVAGAGVPLVGGCAGDDMRMRSTIQFHGRSPLRGAVVAAAIASDAPFGIGVRHGWQAVGEPMLVTSSSGNRVHELDGRPALDAYLARLEAPAAVHADPEAFTRFAMTHPLGLVAAAARSTSGSSPRRTSTTARWAASPRCPRVA